MTKLDKIKQDIASLSVADVYKLSDWLAEYASDRWDQQIDDDAKAGKLDKLFEQAKADHRAALTRPLKMRRP